MGELERDGTVAVAGRRFTWRALGSGPRLLLVPTRLASSIMPRTTLNLDASVIEPRRRRARGAMFGKSSERRLVERKTRVRIPLRISPART